MNKKHFAVLGSALAALVGLTSANADDPLITLDGTGVRVIEIPQPEGDPVIAGEKEFTFTGARLNEDGSVEGAFSQVSSYCADAEGNYDPSCELRNKGVLEAEVVGDVTCLTGDPETGAVWFAVQITEADDDPRFTAAQNQQSAGEVAAGRKILVGRLSPSRDENGEKNAFLDEASLFYAPRLVALPNVAPEGSYVPVNDMDAWEDALDGPVTPANACVHGDAFFLNVAVAQVEPDNMLRFLQKKSLKPHGQDIDGRYPLPRSAPSAEAIQLSELNFRLYRSDLNGFTSPDSMGNPMVLYHKPCYPGQPNLDAMCTVPFLL